MAEQFIYFAEEGYVDGLYHLTDGIETTNCNKKLKGSIVWLNQEPTGYEPCGKCFPAEAKAEPERDPFTEKAEPPKAKRKKAAKKKVSK